MIRPEPGATTVPGSGPLGRETGMDLANCGLDGCEALPWPIRLVMGLAIGALAIGWLVAWFMDRRG